MRRLLVVGGAIVGLMVLVADVEAQRGGRGGMRGAVVGGAVNGEEGAKTGAKIGVITDGSRGIIDKETKARAEYQTTKEYTTTEHSNFNTTPPEIIAGTTKDEAKAPKGETVLRKKDKPVLGVTFPTDWKQKVGENFATATSADGQAWSVIAIMDGVSDKDAAVKKIKEQLEKNLKDVKFDEGEKTKGGAVIITGTGKTMKSGVEVVFAVAAFPAGKETCAAAFVVDSKIDEFYKETISVICQTIRRGDDFKE